MSYTLVLEWMPGDLYMSAVTARCTAPTSSYSVVWLPPNKVYQITLYCGSTSLVSFLVGAFRGKAWSYMRTREHYEKLFEAYPDVVTLPEFAKMLGGIGDSTARKLMRGNHVQHFCIRHTYLIPKTSVIEYVLSEHYAKYRSALKAQV